MAGTVPKLVGSPGDITPVQMPLGLSAAPQTLVVQLSGDPVTVADANSATPLSDSQKEQVRTRLRAEQEPLKGQIQSLGGSVLAQYQSSYNGIKVRIAGDKAASLASLPGVVAVRRLQLFTPDNIHGIPFIGAPQVWDGVAGLHGEGIKIAILDTGIDYTHADFGGPGTVAAWNTAKAQNTADPTSTAVCHTASGTPCFGPNAPRVKGGTDLVGDSYNANPNDPNFQPIPHPDPNPLDCFGHGSHVAGTAAGSGVLADGTTYTGPYNASTIASHSWNVGPGVAPKADIYSVRIFGCAGSTNVTVDAIEWAVDHHMDVINMSLGSPFGTPDEPSAVASTNAAKDGIIVVASAGNSGNSPYLAGSPSTGNNVISVAASDPNQTFAGANLALGTGANVKTINANGATFSDGSSLPLLELKDATGGLSLGCNPADYVAQGAAGKVVITRRGTCARVARAIFGQQAGAAAVVMVNNANGLPPFEGKITSNPDTGIAFNVTIPFLGANLTDKQTLIDAANAATPSVTLTNIALANPGYRGLASFTSFGPRTGDSALKPDVTAPGVSIASVGMGTGNQAAVMSGTSMAAPHTSGMAALVKQAHPEWGKVKYWDAAIVSTADSNGVAGFDVRGSGTGLIQAPAATRTQVVALGDPESQLSFGFAELNHDFSQTKSLTLKNFGDSAATFAISQGTPGGSPHSVSLSRNQVTVPRHGTREVDVRLTVPAATAGDASSFNDVSGLLTLTPVGGSNNGISLRVPYYLVPKAISQTAVEFDARSLARTGTAPASISNARSVATGFTDFFAWGLANTRPSNLGSDGLRAAGAASFPTQAAPSGVGKGWMQFAISTNTRWSNPAMNEFDILVDVNGDGKPDYLVAVADLGAVTAGQANGVDAVFVISLTSHKVSLRYLAGAPTDGTTMEIPVDFSQLCRAGEPCLSATSPRITYAVQSFGADGTSDSFAGSAKFNAFNPALSSANFEDVIAPDGSASDTVSLNRAEFAQTPALGVMIVSQNNPNRASDEGQDGQAGGGGDGQLFGQTQLIPVSLSEAGD